MLISIELILLIIGIFLLRFRDKLSYLSLLAFSLFISIPDLYYVPTNDMDLYRYFREMNIIQSCDNIKSLFVEYHINPELLYHSNNYLYNIFQWMIAKNNNYALLAFLSVFIIYTCISLPFLHQYIITKRSIGESLFIGLISMIALFPYYNSSSTVRWCISVSILVLLLYVSCNCKHPIITLPFYLIPLFIHQGMLLPVIIIIICVLFRNVHIGYNYIFIEIGLLLLIYVFGHVTSIGSNNISTSFQSYNIMGISSIIGSGRISTISFLGLFIISYVYLLLGIKLIMDNKRINFNLEIKLSILFVLVDLSLFSNLIISNRYAICVGIVGILIYLKVLKNGGYISNRIKYIYLITSCAYVLVGVFAISEMSFNFSQINYGGSFINLFGF